MSRINWRQILVHAIAFWFFMYAFQTLSYLFHLKLIDIVRVSNNNLNDAMTKNDIGPVELTSFLITEGFANIGGLITAFIISLLLSRKNKWFWINSLIALLLVIILSKTGINLWDTLRPVFYSLGWLFSNSLVTYLINGILLLSIGLLLLFLNPINRFITGRMKTD